MKREPQIIEYLLVTFNISKPQNYSLLQLIGIAN